MNTNRTNTICWNCKKAIGGCTWSDFFKPVKGWTAEQTRPAGSKPYTSYIVEKCPEFERDATDNGLRRYKPQKAV